MKSMKDRTGQDRTGQDRTGQDRTGQDRTGQGRAGQDSTGNAPAGLTRIDAQSTCTDAPLIGKGIDGRSHHGN